jgi:glycerol-3-phosphate dehydrogenase
MRPAIRELDGREFDICVVGGGINGASAAQHLAAAGFSVLVVDQGDFGSGTSSRSSRMQGCGLNYFQAYAPQGTLWRYLFRPDRFLGAASMARSALRMRAEMVHAMPGRLRMLDWYYPLYRSHPAYSRVRIESGLRLIDALAPADNKLAPRHLGRDEALAVPLLSFQRDIDDLVGAMRIDYVELDWPERITVDLVLDAERMGAVVRNYAAVVAMSHVKPRGWDISIQDVRNPNDTVGVHSKVVVNTTGIWVDAVNRLGTSTPGRRLHFNKGVHIAFRLPPECGNQAAVNFFDNGDFFFCAPVNNLHFVGPTEQRFDGPPDDVAITETDIEELLAETNRAWPGMELRRKDILFAWAGVRPLTYAGAGFPHGKRFVAIHDMGSDGLPNLWALTGGPLMTQRSAGQEITNEVARRIEPSGPPRLPDYSGCTTTDTPDSPPLDNRHPGVRLADLRYAAQHEHPQSLVDLLFRRVPVGWSEDMGVGAAQRAAETVADVMGWDSTQITQEVKAYIAYVRRMFAFRSAS